MLEKLHWIPHTGKPIRATPYCASDVLPATRLLHFKVAFYTPASSFDLGPYCLFVSP
ncbi:hypothetical protein SynRS9902_01331 [Synechococcus sp. RS9902]|nr:hypothetical protein SynRS9902_01331 [Synechococcus sp. RS9902]